jgi:hypothetical protein
VLLPDEGLPVARLGPLGLRVADPEAVAPAAARRLLERLGARPATAAAVLADPEVRAAVETSVDAADEGWDTDHDAAAFADAVLALVAAAGTAPGELPWLAELALPDADGGWAPAGELVRPGSRLAAVLADGALGTLDPAVDADRTCCARWACWTASRWCAPRTPTTSTSTARRTGPTPSSSGCPRTRRRRRGRR